MEKKHSHKCLPNSSERPASSSSSLAMHKVSKTISKSSSSSNNSKPKIRIIHIFAPQIIKTDVENFRELVQMKTGKPPPSADGEKMCKQTKIFAASGTDSRRNNNNSNNSLMISGLISNDDDDDDDEDKAKSKSKKMEMMVRNRFTVKEEQVYISDEISSGGYLGGFSDLEEGLISEIGGFSSMLPLD